MLFFSTEAKLPDVPSLPSLLFALADASLAVAPSAFLVSALDALVELASLALDFDSELAALFALFPFDLDSAAEPEPEFWRGLADELAERFGSGLAGAIRSSGMAAIEYP
jgi:hypothetical protein